MKKSNAVAGEYDNNKQQYLFEEVFIVNFIFLK